MNAEENSNDVKEAETLEHHRVQLDFSPESYQRLLEIQKRAGAESKAELIRDALRIFDWLLTQRDAGKSLKLVTSSGEEELVEELF